MIQLIRQLNQVPEPLITAAGIVYKNSDNAIVRIDNSFSVTESAPDAEPFVLAGMVNGQVIIRTRDRIIACDLDSNHRSQYPFEYTGSLQIKLMYDDNMIIRNKTTAGWKLSKYNFRTASIIWEADGANTHLFTRNADLLIATHTEKKEALTCFRETNGDLLWEVSINELGLSAGSYEITGPPQFAGDHIYVGVTDGHTDYLLCLDAGTGQLCWQVKDAGMKFQAADKSILCFVNTEIWQIDAVDGKRLSSADISSHIKLAGIDPYANVIFEDNKMYLAGILDTIISQWNIQTGQLLWHYRIHDTSETGRRGVMIPAAEDAFYVFDNRMYVLDSEQTLYVFEKDKHL
ncbi:outer membrane protein assembly factor BamB family protein [Chitinophaga ginsengisegetis]|uniref:outer membrane protein assembly factor BamB family protein n=1 Tax=Chitinophaga ginsengisegetis TaxID=393003 RepID=UPI000DB96708|nr:PQQ-binding-like beta-propeller repeat protein [Chitinophaga ginsengisegetis]MDR6568787.1 outer membrane protein assembly factor BamB [Chitinophaga ginsengisegetis]MDR6647982.1 outer membrane protein assembly factor BamB [Chitinophaga ginsengisegetis]MDR6654868.1 outer membrane protein assembly factor BamB [Chitinophaga ginsengisegetis]